MVNNAVSASEPADLISHRRVLKIALPIMVSNATLPLLGLVDTMVVGQMGTAIPIGAVGIGAIIITAIYWIFGFLRMGTTGLVAQAKGANDHDEVRLLLWRGVLIGFLGGTLLVIFQSIVFTIGFAVSPASDAVEALALEYMQIRIFSAPAAISSFALSGWLIAQERTKHVLIIQLVTNGLNMVLDALFVLMLGWGVAGVAWASFIAEWSGFALALFFARHALWPWDGLSWARLVEKQRLWRIFAVNRDILIRSLLIEVMFVSLVFFSADLGDVTLAANQILLQFLFIMANMLDGFAFAAEALVGQAIGAKNITMLRRSVKLTFFWSAVCVVILALGFASLGTVFLEMMTTAQDVRLVAEEFLLYIALAPLIGLGAWMLDGVFIGATQTRDMRDMMAVSLAAYLIAVWILLPRIGNDGLWISLLLSFAARGVTLAACYPRLERGAQSSGHQGQ